jgi:DNA-binding transcriptional ArsR family regulator
MKKILAMSSLSDTRIKKASDVIRAISNSVRQQIIAFVDKNPDSQVNQIYSGLRMEQSITSQHLRILREAGVVVTRREGRFVLYNINRARVEQVASAIDVILDRNKRPVEAEVPMLD